MTPATTALSPEIRAFEGQSDPNSRDFDGPARSLQAFLVDLEGYQGPLDLMLDLAQREKLDLAKISVLKLAEQYLAFVRQAQELRLSLAADYLVMAAWLAYLKSRLLVVRKDDEDHEEAEAEAERLRQRLIHLSLIREVGDSLRGAPQLGAFRFARGQKVETPPSAHSAPIEATLAQLLRTYAQLHSQVEKQRLTFHRDPFLDVSAAITRLRTILSSATDWQRLEAFLPRELPDRRSAKSSLAAHFLAALELCKQEKADIRQSYKFAPIEIKRAETKREKS